MNLLLPSSPGNGLRSGTDTEQPVGARVQRIKRGFNEESKRTVLKRKMHVEITFGLMGLRSSLLIKSFQAFKTTPTIIVMLA